MSQHQEFEPGPRGSNVLILSNPKAGRGRQHQTITQLCQALRQSGLQPQIVDSLKELQIVSRRLAATQQLRCAVAVGGDGTARAVANHLETLENGPIPIAVVPMGTENLLARQFKMTPDVHEVTAAITQCKTHTMDAGRVNGQLFLIMFSCGFDADVIQRLHAARSGNISHLSYAKPIADALWRYRFPRLHVIAENGKTDTQESFESHWLFAFNLPNYARGLPIAAEADANDGQFDVCSFRGGSRLAGIFHFATVLTGQHGRWSGCYRGRFTKLSIESGQCVPYQVDGDPGGLLPAELEVLPAYISIVLPADQTGSSGDYAATTKRA